MHGAQLVEPDIEEVADVQRVSARRADRGVRNPQLAVLESPPIGRYEACDSHGVIVTCFGSDDHES